VAPDHTGNAAVTLLPDQVLIYTAETRKPERRDDRPHDVLFLLTHLAELAQTDGNWLAGRLDPQVVGAFGHSFGGFTVCRAAELDQRLKAILPMTLAGSLAETVAPGSCRIPVMVLLAGKDRTLGERGNVRSTAWFDQAAQPKFLINFNGAGHFTFTEMAQLAPNWGDGLGVEKDKEGNVTLTFSDPFADQRITNQYSVAFFDAFLRQDAAARQFIEQNHYPAELEYRKE
jgi:predicted dienelactone hydrolase